MTAPDPFVIASNDLGSATLERWVELIVRADAARWPMVLLDAADPADPIDALALAAACAPLTQTIGLCVSVAPDTVEPFTLARGLAALDHLSRGRAAWRLIGGNIDRNRELVAVMVKLLESWAADALVEDRIAGILSDAGKVGPIDHQGAFFSVRGPLNLPRPPQGIPPLVALSSDPALPEVDLTLDASNILSCSVTDMSLLFDRGSRREGITLRARLGLRS